MEILKKWAIGLIVALVISTLIELILPETKSKNYIKIIIGLFVLYTAISPLVSAIPGIDISKVISNEKAILANSNYTESEISEKDAENQIIKLYVENLKNDIKTKLEGEGYVAESIEITVSDDGNYKLEKIAIQISEKNTNNTNEKKAQSIVENVKKVKVKVEKMEGKELENSLLTESDKKIIKQIIKTNYDVNEENVFLS